MKSESQNTLLDSAIGVGFLVAIKQLGNHVPAAVAVGVSTFLFSFIRSLIGLEYRGLGAPIRLPTDERESVLHNLLRSLVVGTIASILTLGLAQIHLV
jgi:ABC-type Fe3+ transport system permease subunit